MSPHTREFFPLHIILILSLKRLVKQIEAADLEIRGWVYLKTF